MRKQLSKSEIVELNAKLKELYGCDDVFTKKDRVLLVEENNVRLIISDEPFLFYVEETPIPTLKFLLKKLVLKLVTVDMGAVRAVSSGADVMRPGIVSFDESIKEGDVVAVVDATHKKPLCVARALVGAEQLKEQAQGKVLKSLHWVGDKVWSFQ